MAIQRGTQAFEDERLLRQTQLAKLRMAFPTRESFIQMVLHEIHGWGLTPMQANAVQFMDTQQGNYMIQMPRGEGKTLLTAINSVYELILDPTCRVVVFSGVDDLASEIAKFVYDIFNNLKILHFMLPDAQLKDKSSQENFSVCGYLKGLDKSPSVKCRPILGGFEGIRADKIIADDVELLKNSETAPQRAKLRTRIQALEPLLDESKPNQQIIILGTPQSTDSVYNVLPSLGFKVRIWTARVPREKDIQHYGDHLAPYILEMYENNPAWRTGYGLDGTRGKATDPLRYDEEALLKKEATYIIGGGFDLQYMLNTQLADADRFPLKVEKLLFMDVPCVKAPLNINTIRSAERKIKPPMGFAVPTATMYEVMGFSEEQSEFEKTVMYIDPSGGGASSQDEVGYAVVRALNGNIFVDRIHGLKGGYKQENLEHLSDVIGNYWSQGLHLEVIVEDNFGNGMFRAMLQSVLTSRKIHFELQGDHVSGQKELRIIDTILPLLNSNRLIFNTSIIESEVASLQVYHAQKRDVFSVFFQMKHITRERKSLIHDDRLDALSGALSQFSEALVVDQEQCIKKILNDQKVASYRRVFGKEDADEVLERIGLIPRSGYGGLTHLNFGKVRKPRYDSKEKHSGEKGSYEQERERLIQERIEERGHNIRRVYGIKSRNNSGSGRTFYNKRRK